MEKVNKKYDDRGNLIYYKYNAMCSDGTCIIIKRIYKYDEDNNIIFKKVIKSEEETYGIVNGVLTKLNVIEEDE